MLAADRLFDRLSGIAPRFDDNEDGGNAQPNDRKGKRGPAVRANRAGGGGGESFPTHQELVTYYDDAFRRSIQRAAIARIAKLLLPRMLLRAKKRRRRQLQNLMAQDDSAVAGLLRSMPAALLAGVPFFKGWSPMALDSIASSARLRRFERGEVLCYAGDPSRRQSVFVVVSGVAAVSEITLLPDPLWRARFAYTDPEEDAGFLRRSLVPERVGGSAAAIAAVRAAFQSSHIGSINADSATGRVFWRRRRPTPKVDFVLDGASAQRVCNLHSATASAATTSSASYAAAPSAGSATAAVAAVGVAHASFSVRPRSFVGGSAAMDATSSSVAATAVGANDVNVVVLDPGEAAEPGFCCNEMAFLLDLPVLRNVTAQSSRVFAFEISSDAVREAFLAQSEPLRASITHAAFEERRRLLPARYPLTEVILLRLLHGIVRTPMKAQVLAGIISVVQPVVLVERDVIFKTAGEAAADSREQPASADGGGGAAKSRAKGQQLQQPQLLTHRTLALVLSGAVTLSSASATTTMTKNARGRSVPQTVTTTSTRTAGCMSLVGVDRLYDDSAAGEAAVVSSQRSDCLCIKVLGKLVPRVSDTAALAAATAAAAATASASPAESGDKAVKPGDGSQPAGGGGPAAPSEYIPIVDDLPELCLAVDRPDLAQRAHAFRQELRLQAMTCEYPAGATLCSTSDVADRAIVVKTGTALVGGKQPVARNEAIGWSAAVVPHRWLHHIVAAPRGEVQTLEFSRATVRRLAARHGLLQVLTVAVTAVLFPRRNQGKEWLPLSHRAGELVLRRITNPALYVVSDALVSQPVVARETQRALGEAAAGEPASGGNSPTQPALGASDGKSGAALPHDALVLQTRQPPPRDDHEVAMQRLRRRFEAPALQGPGRAAIESASPLRSRREEEAREHDKSLAHHHELIAKRAAKSVKKYNLASADEMERWALASNPTALRRLQRMAAMTQQASQSQSQLPPAGLQAAALLFDEEEAAQRRQEVQRRLRKFLIAQRIPLAYIGRYLTGYVDDLVAGGGADDSSMSWSTVPDAKVDHDADEDRVPHRRLNFFFTSPDQVHGARGSPVSAVRQARGAESKKQQQRSAELPISFVALAAAAAAAASSPHDFDTVVDSVSVGTQTALSHMTKVAKLRDFRRQHRRDTSSLDATDPNANECD